MRSIRQKLSQNDGMAQSEWGPLLCRPGIAENPELSHALHADKAVLITGAGGSIGSALAEELVRCGARLLILLDSSEQNLYQIDRRLHQLCEEHPSRHVAVLGSVEDSDLLDGICARYRPEIAYHAAAYKHVPLMEAHPLAAMRNNAMGAYRLAQAAVRNRVGRLLMISTDKAAAPASWMGVSKRVAECVLLACGTEQTRMGSLRLGNVLGSEGSVVPLFLEQIAHGGPVTITHPEAERYFFTMRETVSLILQAAACEKDSGILIPDTEKAVRILDLATFLIQRSERPDRDSIPISWIGLRPGEKIQEEFLASDERMAGACGLHLRAVTSQTLPLDEMRLAMCDLQSALRARSVEQVLRIVQRMVPGYRPARDWIGESGVLAARSNG
jgi:FlaA1/EpsC-like NDP-sugar epimerase